MDMPKKPRFRLGLRTLIGVVTVCAIVLAIVAYPWPRPPREVRLVQMGMSRKDVAQVLGQKPTMHGGIAMRDVELMEYRFDWGYMVVRFAGTDTKRCDDLGYFRKADSTWHARQFDGSFKQKP